MKQTLTIAIDGFSSTGKSSISQIIAKTLGIIHLDTGALYRAITLYGLRNCLTNGVIDQIKLIRQLPEINVSLQLDGAEYITILNGEDVTGSIREGKVSENVSFVAKIPEVRKHLLFLQQQIASQGGVVMDGRDIGTVVMPNADYKFFLTASIEERARRRFLELQSLGLPEELEAVKQNLIERDLVDSQRDNAPLMKATDAILIDNSDMTKQETIEKILSYIS